jgi:hypothetical protein
MDRDDTRRHRARVSTVIVVALFASGLAACGGSGSSTTKAAAVGTNASAATPAASTNASAGGGTRRGKDATPGAVLAAGQPANVSFQATTSSGASGPTYKLQVTVESIKKGSLKDFNGIQLNANEKASTPYYATVLITNVGPTSFNTSSNDPAISVEGVDDTGNTDTSVTFFGTFPPCPDADTPNPLRTGRASRPASRIWCPAGSRRWPIRARTRTRPHQSPGP